MSQSIQATLASDCRPVDPASQCLGLAHLRDRYSKILLLLFFVTLPLVNPWVRGDGVGYYAYIRSLLIEHKLDFANDWRAANESFSMGRVRPDGSINPLDYTRTGHLDNHFAVGPSILWAPFIVPVHYALLTVQRFGINVQANGYSRPYVVTMALATALYGFLGLLISFRLARLYTDAHWAFLATLGIWFASSLPVYMYFNPSWSHAQSAFVVALFLWYWQRTRQGRTLVQWIIFGLLSGLMLDVYYLNIAMLLIPFLESLRHYVKGLRNPRRDWAAMRQLFKANIAYCFMVVVAFLPTLITRKIIYGSPFDLGYSSEWTTRPALRQVLFSSDHGLLTWTPILILAILGLFLLLKRDKELAGYLFISFLAFYVVVSLHSNWDGLSSFGNRFFISLTPIFVLGLAVSLSEFAKWLGRERKAMAFASSVTALLILWNLAFIFQWGMHMVPPRGPISWKQMVRNQFVAVPQQAGSEFAAYIENRKALMRQIERDDVRQLKLQQGAVQTK